MNILWQQQIGTSPTGRQCSHSAIATRAQTNSHIFFSSLFSSVNTQVKGGRVKQWGFGGNRLLLCRYTGLQADALAIVNWTQTLKKWLLFLTKKRVLYFCFDFQLPNFRYLLFTLSIKFVMICIPGIRNSVGPLNQLLM